MKYLALLSVVLITGCASVSGNGGGYRDYTAADKDGVVRVHRVYDNGQSVWLNQSEAGK